MTNPCASGHPLYIPRTNDGTIAEAIPMFQPSLQNIGNNLHVLMTVGAKPLPWLDLVFVNYSQYSKPPVGGVIVITERKSMATIQPIQLSMTPIVTGSHLKHEVILRAKQV